MANKRKKVEFVRAITGPSIESKNEELPRYSTWNFGEGIKVNPSPYFQKHEIEIDEDYVVDLINQHGGGGGGNPSAWAFYSASHDVDMDGKRITNMAEPILPSDATPRFYVDNKLSDKQFFNKNSANQLVGNFDYWSAMAYRQEGPMPTSNPLGSADGYVAIQPNNFVARTRGISYQAPNYHQTGSIRLRDRGSLPLSFEVSLESRLPEHTGSISFRMSPSSASHPATVYWTAPFFSGSRLDLFDADNVTLPNNEPSILAALNYLDDRIESGSGGGGINGHVINEITEDEFNPIAPLPQRANLVFVNAEMMDMPELDLTVVQIPEPSFPKIDTIRGLTMEGYAQNALIQVSANYDMDNDRYDGGQIRQTIGTSDTNLGFSIQSYYKENELSSHEIWTNNNDLSSPIFRIQSGSSGHSIEFKNAPLSIEAPIASNHAATKAYVDSAISSSGGGGGSPWYTVNALSNVNLNTFRITALGEPVANTDAATKGYVDSIAGIAASISEGEITLTRDTGNDTNVSAASAGPLRFTRIGRTVTLSGTVNVTADSAGATTAAFSGISGAALPATNNTWRSIILDTSSHITKPLNVMVYPAGDFRFTVVGAEAGVSYRISFVMTYRSVA